ncbi:unnamed protein product, partial [Symbiodinium sp. CCMP2456]
MGGQASVAATMALEDGSFHGMSANMEGSGAQQSEEIPQWVLLRYKLKYNDKWMGCRLNYAEGTKALSIQVSLENFLNNDAEGKKVLSVQVSLRNFLNNDLEGTKVFSIKVNFVVLLSSTLEGTMEIRRGPQLYHAVNQAFKINELLNLRVQQLQAEMRRLEESPEQCKPGTTTLPALAPPNGNESAVALQERAQQSYKMWAAAGPYERLALKPPAADDLEKGKYSRLSARTAGMMLQAMAEVVRAEMVARAITRSPVALLFRLYTMYQPGGESEKAYILQYLVSPPKASTATDLVTILRQWERLLLRVDNLSIEKPDPSLLVRGLNNVVSELRAKDIHDNGTYDDFYKYASEWKRRALGQRMPTKNEGGDGTPFKPKGKAKPKSAPTTPTAKDDGGQGGSAAARAMVAEPEPQPPAPTSPVNQEGSQQGSQSGEVKDALRDAAQALRSLMSPGSTTASSPASTLEGLQRQLDELRLKTMKVSEEVSVLRMTQRTPLDGRAALEPTE